MSLPLSRQAYAAMYGPTVSNRVHLGDTNLLAEFQATNKNS